MKKEELGIGGLSRLGKYDVEVLGVHIDRRTRIELNPKLQGLGSHPRAWQLKRVKTRLGKDISNIGKYRIQ